MPNGQAEIERGFSINKEVMKDNMSELTLVSRRLVKDFLRSNSLETHKVNISSRMISLVQQSSSKYKQFLKEKQEREKTEAELKRNNEITKQLNFYKKEKQQKEKKLYSFSRTIKSCLFRGKFRKRYDKNNGFVGKG